MNFKPQFYVDWQERQALKKAQAIIDNIHKLGGFTATDLETAVAQARSEGVAEGVAENQIKADGYLAQVVEAVQVVLELNDLSSRSLISKVRAYLRRAEKVQREKARQAQKAYQEMLELEAQARTAKEAAATTSSVLDVLSGVNLNSNANLALPE